MQMYVDKLSTSWDSQIKDMHSSLLCINLREQILYD